MRLVAAVLVALAPVSARAVDVLTDLPGKVGAPTEATEVTVDGMLVRMRSVVSKKDVSALKAHVIERFKKADLYLADDVNDAKLTSAEQVTALDPDNLVSYTVLFQKGKKGTTTVIVGAADLSKRASSGGAAQAFAPVMPGAGGVSVTSLESMKTMTYPVHATPAEIKKYYSGAMAVQGYVEVEPQVFEREGDRVVLSVTPGLTERTVVLTQELAARH